MIYITGDTHGDIARFSKAGFPEEPTLTEKDYIIVCGDFGFVFPPKDHIDYPTRQEELDMLSKKPYTILFIDGNHENFPLIYEYPLEMWNGGKVHRLRPNIMHLMRGQVYNIDGTVIFTMGGAYSIDKAWRIEGRSWWKEELPTNEEYAEASENLKKAGGSVDVIISHTAPREIIRRIIKKEPVCNDMELTGFLEWVMYEIKFKKWYFGHWHTDDHSDDKFTALYFDVVPYENRN